MRFDAAVCISCEESSSNLCRHANRVEIVSYAQSRCSNAVINRSMTGRKFSVRDFSYCVVSICALVETLCTFAVLLQKTQNSDFWPPELVWTQIFDPPWGGSKNNRPTPDPPLRGGLGFFSRYAWFISGPPLFLFRPPTFQFLESLEYQRWYSNNSITYRRWSPIRPTSCNCFSFSTFK